MTDDTHTRSRCIPFWLAVIAGVMLIVNVLLAGANLGYWPQREGIIGAIAGGIGALVALWMLVRWAVEVRTS